MIVVDAGVLTTALVHEGTAGDVIRSRLSNEDLAAPAVIDLEVTSVLRRLAAAGRVPERRAAQALEDLVDLPVERAAHTPLLARCWQLRANVTAYDAAYVALAEVLDVPLLTGDRRLARASGPRCTFDVLAPG